MSPGIIVDTGPVVALLNAEETLHPWVLEQLAKLSGPMLTCEAVISETLFLLRRVEGGARQVTGLLRSGGLRLDFSLATELPAVSELLVRYRQVPMSLADACLVRMSELRPRCQILTFDGHFRIYRRHGRQAVPAIMPPQGLCS